MFNTITLARREVTAMKQAFYMNSENSVRCKNNIKILKLLSTYLDFWKSMVALQVETLFEVQTYWARKN